jgi:uncharacterized protein
MKIICVEEHAVDPGLAQASAATILSEAPYMRLCCTPNAASRPRDPQYPTLLSFDDANALGVDLGEARIKTMDEHRVDMQVVSIGNPAQLAPRDEAVALTQAANTRLAQAIDASNGRLSGFAALPWQDPAAAADELSRAVGELGLKGALILGRPGATFLDDPIYAPVLRRLNELKMPLYVHPFYPLPQVQESYYARLSPEIEAQLSLVGWGWHHEAGLQVLRLVLSGAFETFPDLRIISGHWGEMVPFFLNRLDDMMPERVTGLSRSITDSYRANVWVTPSGLFERPQFDFIHTVLGADRIIWATDYPYLTLDGTRGFLEGLPISEEDRHKIAHGNAEAILGV